MAIREQWAEVPIVGLFCAGGAQQFEFADSLLEGLDDYVICPFTRVDLIPRIRRILQRSHKPRANQASPFQSDLDLETLVGNSKRFLEVVKKVPSLAQSAATVLITGETGTGKELVARAIHYRSPRRGKPFIPVNCGALPDSVFESEFFGHVKGAFTDASISEKGLVGEAEGGTLFLDEVDVLSLTAQVKLLRFLQDKEYKAVGSSKNLTADVRVIAATNTNLWDRVQAKQFREDIYYRLNMLALRLPPLRERSDDIPLLAAHFVERYGGPSDGKSNRLSPLILQKLLAYHWPGNVRELEAVILRALTLNSTMPLKLDDIELPISVKHPSADTGLFRSAKAQAIEQFERAYLTDLLCSHKGNITSAARDAGKERRSFQRLLRKYGLERQAFRKLS